MFIKDIPLGFVGANCYIICDEKSGEGAVIDAGEYNRELLTALSESPIKNLKYIFCTHCHFDHTSGVSRLKEKFPDALVAIGHLDVDGLCDSHKSVSDVFGAPFYKANADVLLADKDILKIGDIELKVISTDGHSLGGVCFYCKSEKLLFSGDTLFKGSVGRTDLCGGDFAALMNSLKILRALPDDTAVFAGHGESTTIGEEKSYNPYL